MNDRYGDLRRVAWERLAPSTADAGGRAQRGEHGRREAARLKAFGRMCDAAGIRRVRLHDLRYTCASMLLAQSVPPRVVMEILGHSSLDVTMTIYGHVMLDAQRQALEGMDGLLDDE